MKKIELTVKPFQLSAVKDALVDLGIEGMTVSEVRGVKEPGPKPAPRGGSFAEDYTPRIKIEIVVANGLVTEALDAIRAALGPAHAARRDNIVVAPVDKSIRIRTGEPGHRAA